MGMWVIAIARTTFAVALPAAAVMPIARMNAGNAMIVSTTRMTSWSTSPPRYPASAPRTEPVASAIAAAASESESRESRRQATAARPRRTGARSAEADAGVDKAVDDVHREVDQHVDDGDEEHEALDRRRVLGEQRGHRVVADAGPCEHDLDDHVAGHQEAEDHADQRDHRDHAVPQRVAVHDRPPRQAGPPPRPRA